MLVRDFFCFQISPVKQEPSIHEEISRAAAIEPAVAGGISEWMGGAVNSNDFIVTGGENKWITDE